MSSKYRNAAFKKDKNRISLMYTLNAISHLSREEFELLKKLRQNKDQKALLDNNEIEIFPKVQKILDHFNAKSIQEVIDIVEHFQLFELYNFAQAQK